MKQRLRPLPIRVRLALSLILLVLAFFLVWFCTGWAWPTRELAYRALETSHGFGPGEIVAQGEVTFEEGYSNRYTDRPSAWMIGRFGDSFAAAVLEQTPGPLWRACDIYGFQVLTSTEETPLVAAELAKADRFFRLSDGQWDDETEYLWAICALDPAIVRVEMTMNYTYRLAIGDGYSDPMESDPVTVQAQPMGSGVWLARVRSPDPLEGRSGGYSVNYSLRGYGAAGQLLCDSGPQ